MQHATSSYASIYHTPGVYLKLDSIQKMISTETSCDVNLNTFSVMLAYIHVKHIGMVLRKMSRKQLRFSGVEAVF